MPHTTHKHKLQMEQESKCKNNGVWMKVLDENMGDFFFNFGIRKNFLTMTQNPETIFKN